MEPHARATAVPPKPPRPLMYQSADIVALIVLEFLVEQQRKGEPRTSAYFIQQHARKLKSQQFARIQDTLLFLEQSGWVDHEVGTGGTFYRVTRSGEDFWTKAGRLVYEALSKRYPSLANRQPTQP